MSSLLEKVKQQRAKLQRPANNRTERLVSEKNVVRILVPTFNGEEQLSQDWSQHWIKDQTGALKAVYVCTEKMFDEPCEVCAAIAAATAATSDEETLKALKDARHSHRVIVNAMYIRGGKNDNPETQPVVLELPPTVWDAILATYQTFMEEDVNVFDLNEGHNFIIEKTGTGMNTEYKVTPQAKASKVNPEMLDKCTDLATWARQESESERAKAVTSVRVISGTGGATTARLASPTKRSETNTRLADADPDVLDAEFNEVGDGDLDDFLRDL